MAFETVLDSNGVPLSYNCTTFVTNNQVDPIDLQWLYDLRYPADETDEDEKIKCIEDELLQVVANRFEVPGGERCSMPPDDGGVWIMTLTSNPPDEPSAEIDSCISLGSDSTHKCTVIQAQMYANLAVGSGEASDLLNVVRAAMDSWPENQCGAQVKFLGTDVEDPRNGSLPQPINEVQAPQSNDDKQKITIVGGLLLGAIVLAVLGIVVVLLRRRRRYLYERDVDIALSKSEGQFGDGLDGMDEDGTFEQDALDEDDGPEAAGDRYTFDLGNSLKNDLFHVHGSTSAQPRPAFSQSLNHSIEVPSVMDETTDSDADSWAQTDGTIGSLELHLEPITAEV